MFLHLTLATFLAASITKASEYVIDPSHSYIGFKVKHLGISNVKGDFKKYEGTGTFDEKAKKISNIKFTIKADSITTSEADRDKHLKSADFFETNKFSDLKFEATSPADAKTGAILKGKLTIKDITKDITLKISNWGGTVTDAWGNERVAFQASGTIDRRDYGLKWQKPLSKMGGLTVGNEVTLDLEIEAIKAKSEK